MKRSGSEFPRLAPPPPAVVDAALALVDVPEHLAVELQTAALKLEQGIGVVALIETHKHPVYEYFEAVWLYPYVDAPEGWKVHWYFNFPLNDPKFLPMFKEAQDTRSDVQVTFSWYVEGGHYHKRSRLLHDLLLLGPIY